ncbi:unnamed protein product [Euphydryas editha]|uniref:Major facilitator superfamily (MFS) profile domain-containing protein n=1 Tax=Euphydryas editha TaxID=104508 RepID=A0AAU9UHX1_EUPED|nr:unnamed protein product [Euphydryas editha]
MSVAAGFSFGFSAVLLPQLNEDQNFPYTDDLASWIASITPLSMVIGSICAGSMIDGLGRKIGHIILATLSIISWLVIASSTNITLLLIGRFISGLSSGPTRPVSLVYIGEITEPKYRKYSLMTPSLLLNVGILLSHIMGEYFSWKTSSYIYAAINIFCSIPFIFLKEAPLWLISKGKTDEGIQAFKWFRGKGSEAEKELNLILQRQIEKENKYFIKDIFTKSFTKPLLTSVLLAAAAQFNGINSLGFYAKDILGNTVKGGVDPFILMIIYDMMRILTFVIIYCFNKYIPRKIFLISVSICCCIALFGLFALLTFTDVSKYVWLSITIIIIYIVSAGCIVALTWSFVPELFSGKLRGLGSGITASISFLSLFICVKITPGFIVNYGENAMYACYGVVTVIITVILCFLLPETNGRTLQNIEDSYKKNEITKSTV